jgi:hypothetical protein
MRIAPKTARAVPIFSARLVFLWLCFKTIQSRTKHDHTLRRVKFPKIMNVASKNDHILPEIFFLYDAVFDF